MADKKNSMPRRKSNLRYPTTKNNLFHFIYLFTITLFTGCS